MVFFSCCYERGSSFPAGASVPAGASQISYFKILPWKPKETSSFRDEDIQNKITAVMAGGIPIGTAIFNLEVILLLQCFSSNCPRVWVEKSKIGFQDSAMPAILDFQSA